MKALSVGSDTACDLVLDQDGVAPRHAHIERDANGHLWLTEHASRPGLFARRNGEWRRVQRIVLCIGDRVRLGEAELPLERLAALFADDREVALRPAEGPPPTRERALPDEARAAAHRPKRNPLTGAIEDSTP